jgi:type I restriction enzyme S subunit
VLAFEGEGPARPLVRVSDPTRPICYGILKPKTTGELTVPYVEVRSIRSGRIDVASLHRTTQALHEEFHRSELHEGDVVLAIRGSFDRAAVVPPDLDGANVSRDVARIAPGPDIDPRFLAHYLAGPAALRYYSERARGVGVRGVNIGDLRTMPIPVPRPDEQEKVVGTLELQLSLIDDLSSQVDAALRRSAALRRAILNQAFNGKLVPQDPSDEPAAVLLERIAAERAAQSTPRRRKARA